MHDQHQHEAPVGYETQTAPRSKLKNSVESVVSTEDGCQNGRVSCKMRRFIWGMNYSGTRTKIVSG